MLYTQEQLNRNDQDDLIECLKSQEEPESQINPKVAMIHMCDVEQTEVKWLWYPYIPFGKLTIVQGDPGNGKTYLSMQLAAGCSTANTMIPGMKLSEPFNVIY